jgi:hypothetical protein
MDKRKELVAQYQEQERVMGVYKITNEAEAKTYVGSSLNIPSAWNRDQFVLTQQVHPNKQLQADWKRIGAGNFTFKILQTLDLEVPVRHDYKDLITPEGIKRDVARDYRQSLQEMEELWIEELGSVEPNGYNKRQS